MKLAEKHSLAGEHNDYSNNKMKMLTIWEVLNRSTNFNYTRISYMVNQLHILISKAEIFNGQHQPLLQGAFRKLIT